jgi:uncharacterized membrane protein
MTETSLTGAEAPAETTRSPFTVVGWAGPLAGLVVAIVFLTQTDWYSVFKVIHVLAAIVWLGGGTAITVLALRAQRAKDNVQLFQIGSQAEWMSLRVFVPSSLVVLAMGLVLMHKGSWGYGHFWPLFGLIAWAVSFAVGAGFLGPQSGRLAKLFEEKGAEHPETQARLNRIITVARADVALLLVVALDMVAKPFLS